MKYWGFELDILCGFDNAQMVGNWVLYVFHWHFLAIWIQIMEYFYWNMLKYKSLIIPDLNIQIDCIITERESAFDVDLATSVW